MRLHEAFVALVLLFCGTGTAAAQMGNEPFQPFRSGASVGMSTGYRQAILEQKLRASTPAAMVRAPDGTLLEVSRYGSRATAFVTAPADAFVPGTLHRADTALGSLGWRSPIQGPATYAAFQDGGTSLRWIQLLEHPAIPVGMTGGGSASSPLNDWIYLVLG